MQAYAHAYALGKTMENQMVPNSINTEKIVLLFGSEFSWHPCSVPREQRNLRMLCFVKKILERIKDVDFLRWKGWQ